MDIEEMIDALEDVTNRVELRRLRKAVDARVDAIRRAEYQRGVTARWAKLERCKPGTILYVGGRGTVRIGSSDGAIMRILRARWSNVHTNRRIRSSPDSRVPFSMTSMIGRSRIRGP